MKKNTQKIKRLVVLPITVFTLLKSTKQILIHSEVPEDAKLLNYEFNPNNNCLEFLIESEEFEEVEEGAIIPKLKYEDISIKEIK